MKHAYVEIEGPFGYSGLRIVKTGSNATVTFNIPDSKIPYGRPYKVRVHSEGLIVILLPNCDTFTRGNEPWMWIGMYVPS
jgi:hypothetical protein